MARLFEAAQVAAMQPQELEEYITTMVTERDIRNQIAYAEERGLEKGIAQGIRQGIVQGATSSKRDIAKSLKAGGMDINSIAKHTGLEISEIEQL
jgi:predicted transposase/invertase (TIGR01784 family)